MIAIYYVYVAFTVVPTNCSSSQIGLMRGGRLLEEKSPAELLREHNTNLLEDIVLNLCRNDHIGNLTEDNDDQEEISQNDEQFKETKVEFGMRFISSSLHCIRCDYWQLCSSLFIIFLI